MNNSIDGFANKSAQNNYQSLQGRNPNSVTRFSANHYNTASSRVQSAFPQMQQKAKLYRGGKPPAQPNIRLGSGTGPTSNMFKVKNGKLMLTKI